MTNYDEAYANAMMVQNAKQIADAGVAFADGIKAKAQARKVKRVLEEKDEYIAELIRRGDIWEDRATAAETAEAIWIRMLRELFANNQVINISKEELNKRFDEQYEQDLSEKMQEISAKRSNR
ncbi:hypothetical protein Q9L42_020980 (plasmid) [Methylomarinum sp. Ch1-1]|uniref:Uncharacterized protein n=1 Tax=Methylomarinum roseum TaxID=3067653 RepID=A0AAU7P0K7_9GAMM|nr:hypothetical protein [Methylomarinum sp. Ch1-1]MDP4518999.1 hypothetical protein [Methylomarinum sp. Ch1-1]MDP4523397.1 hypothetical protein [Methylomarinum sp. Ch1-1]